MNVANGIREAATGLDTFTGADSEQAQALMQQLSVNCPTIVNFLDNFNGRRYVGSPPPDEYPEPDEVLGEEFVNDFVAQTACAFNKMLTNFPPLAFKTARDVSSWTEGECAPVPDLNQFFVHIYNCLHTTAGTADMVGMAQLAASIRTFDRPLYALWACTCSHYTNTKTKEILEAAQLAADSGELVSPETIAGLTLLHEAFTLVRDKSWADLCTLIQIMHLMCKIENFAIPSCDNNPAWRTFKSCCHKPVIRPED